MDQVTTSRSFVNSATPGAFARYLLCVLFITQVLLTLPRLALADEPREGAPSDDLIPITVSLPAGAFYMGDLSGGWDGDERPVFNRKVDGFAIGKFEITRNQFKPFADAAGLDLEPLPEGDTGNRPVSQVSWKGARAYARWLSEKTGHKWRLPSEAEWEYAARAGSNSLYQSGNMARDLCAVGNIADASATAAGNTWDVTDCEDGHGGSAPVGTFTPNDLGLYDLHGNVWEWIDDCYGAYKRSGPSSGSLRNCATRVIRGGSYRSPAASARFSNRDALAEIKTRPDVGFRLVREP